MAARKKEEVRIQVAVDVDAIMRAFETISKSLKPLSEEERKRVIQANIELYEIKIPRGPRTHEGDHECA